jgi:kynureninase
MESVAAAVDDSVALIMLSLVNYRSAAIAEMAAINDLGRAHGALTLWDLSHAVGAVPVALGEAGADLAVGCTYKYLSGGPGAPAFLYVRRDLQNGLQPPIWGWFGHQDQFAFEPRYLPAPGIERFLVGTPPILSVAAAMEGVEIVAEAGIEEIRAKSVKATQLMIELFDGWLAPLGVTLGSPREARRRGSHLALRHPSGLAISSRLRAEAGVVTDFRPPDTIRAAVAPLYTTYAEVWKGMAALRECLTAGTYRDEEAGGRIT